MNYKDTLNMPKTEFPMRGNLGVREIEFQKRWNDIGLYEKVLKQNEGNPSFVLHDGPPYANGDIHIGHTLNKVLKDFVLRYRTMQGNYTPYVPGWDTHGLPIETALSKRGIDRKTMPLADYRKLCYDFALEQVERQKRQFQRLGILGTWDNPYITLKPEYEARQIKIFASMVKRGLIYKGLKPVYWSPSSESALAEAEIEYMDKESTSVYVAFKAHDARELNDVNFVVWTTTPWTFPANLAVSVHPRFTYSVVLVNNVRYVVAKSLLGELALSFGWDDYEVVGEHTGKELEGMTYEHPLFNKICPIILGEHVTDTDGTGLVHTAPGHGEDDYRIGRSYGLDVFCPVDDHGVMTEEAEQFAGLYYSEANERIVAELEMRKTLLRKDRFKHSYPHDWRTKKPVIFRATPQWFASIDKLKTEVLEEIGNVSWLPKWGEVRITNMVRGREDWCISRQRAWGVPIPVFYAENDEPILDENVLDHISDLFGEHGSNIWYQWEAKDLLPVGYEHPGSPNGLFRKEQDIMDVWFDSGTSHSVLQARGLPYPSDLYLEGSDQYRGWFNSSLITGVAAFGKAPYKKVVSHGFVLDGQGRKMSKSLGNTVDPLKVIEQQGADLLRLWVASVDYQSDVRISQEVVRQIAESYRKIRNTFRFMLGNLKAFDPMSHYVDDSKRPRMDQVMMMKYNKVSNQVIDAYENYAFDRVSRLIVPFMINELSAYYLDYTKDILYIEKEDDFKRRSVQSTIHDMLLGLLKLLTPIIPHTTSEAYQSLPFSKKDDIYLERMPKQVEVFDDELLESFDLFFQLRDVILKHLEDARANKVIGKSLQAHVSLIVTEEQKKLIDSLQMNIEQVLIVSSVDLKVGDRTEVVIKEAEGFVCERCWNVVSKVDQGGLCPRCASIVGENR